MDMQPEQQKKLSMFQLKLSGMSYEDIGQHYGVSKQAVQQMLTDVLSARSRRRKTAFPGIDQYLFATGSNVTDLYRAAQVDEEYNTFLRKLKGITRMTLEDIRAILRATGLTFEEAFGAPCKQPETEAGDPPVQ